MKPGLRLFVGVMAFGCAIAIAKAETIRFGAILPLTGQDAADGTQQMQGIRFAVDRTNAAGGVHGNMIEVLFEDSQANPDQAVARFNNLADNGPPPVIFTAGSSPSLALAPLATRAKVLLVNASAPADELATASPYLVNTLPTIGQQVQALSGYLVGKGLRDGAVLYQNDAGGIEGRNDFVKLFPEAGGTILSQQPSRVGQFDYRPALLQLADAEPQVILLSVATALPTLARQFRHLGLQFTVAGIFRLDPDILADPSLEGFIHVQVHDAAPRALAGAFQQSFGAPMGFLARQYYTATHVVLTVADTLLSEGKPLTGEVMRDTLFQLGTFNGLTSLTFNSNTATVPVDINVVRDGKDVTIKQVRTD